MSVHGIHPDGDAILFDGCDECEHRAGDIRAALAHLDTPSFRRAWARAAQLQQHGLPDGQHAELPLLRALVGVQLQFERMGFRYGELPTPPVNWRAIAGPLECPYASHKECEEAFRSIIGRGSASCPIHGTVTA